MGRATTGIDKPQGPARRNCPGSLIYRLNLDVIGGAEVCFAQYAAYRRAQRSLQRPVVAMRLVTCSETLARRP